LRTRTGAVGGRVQAEPAEDALVDVLGDDLHPAAGACVDVDGAGLLQPAGQRGVARDSVVDLDADERRVRPHAALRSASLAFTRSGISEISSATVIPASARRAIFSAAVSSLPLHDRAGGPEGHAGHLVHEPAGHEGDDGQA
jgi:hypothetical protein